MPSSARAHLGHVILNAERYLKLDIADTEVRVVVSLTLGANEGQRVLRAADEDHDGTVSRGESDRYLAQWGEGLATELPIWLDERPVEVLWGEGFLDPVGRVRPVPVTVEMVAHVPLAGGEQTIRVDDDMVRRDVFDRTDVAFRVRDQAELLASGAESEPDEPLPELAYDGAFHPDSPIPLVAVIRTPARPAGSRRTSLLIAAGGLVLLLLVGAWQRTT